MTREAYKQLKESIAQSIRMLSKNPDWCRFEYAGITITIKRLRDDTYPPEADDACGEWDNEEFNTIACYPGQTLFVLYQDYYDFNDKAKRILSGNYAQLYSFGHIKMSNCNYRQIK